jgi:two-component system NtrC family response regulator/two-component system nitrogen regulation response regulator GlnG
MARHPVAWWGPPPPGELASKLASLGFEIGPPTSATAARVVHTTRRGDPPRSPFSSAWLWVAKHEVSQQEAIEATRAGAYDVISLGAKDALAAIERRLRELLSPPPATTHTELFAGKSESSRKVLEQVARAAETSMPVLLTGETGTGKEVCARLIHEWSRRRGGRFVPINCAAIPNELMEAELFGYARGAFSGASHRYEGLLVAAEGGTVFLDEIDDTPLSLQVKLLRVLQDRVVSRLGENEWHEVDFRIIAATNRDLPRLIEEGLFGADLYERLAIVSIAIPRLRERIEDLEDLVAHFLAKFYRDEPHGTGRGKVHKVSPRAFEALHSYPWPGNVRELRNVLYEALVYKRSGDEILLSDLPRRVLGPKGPSARGESGLVDRAAISRRIDSGTMNLRQLLDEVERTALEEALARSGDSPTKAARLLGEVGRGRSSDPGGTVRAMVRRLERALPGRKRRQRR